MSRSCGLLLILLLSFAGSLTLTAHAEFQFGQYTIESGKRLDVSLPVPAGESDPATFIPVSVFAGHTDGPTVLIIAGVHGYEFSPILAAEKLANDLSAQTLRGNVVIVRTAHVAAFENRSVYVNPFDRKNLNRSFPGSAHGTQTERIAHVLSTQVIPTADFVFDVHCGDGAEWLASFAGVYGGPLSSGYDTALGVARALGLPNVVRYSMNTQEQVDTRRSLNRQAVAQGLPTVLVEVGENGKRDPRDVYTIVRGLRDGLAFLQVLPARETAPGPPPRFFDGTSSMAVEHSGLWYPTHRAGRYVQKGDRLGIIKSYSGEVLATVTAPVAGYTLYGLAGPPVKAGESVVTIAKPVDTLEN